MKFKVVKAFNQGGHRAVGDEMDLNERQAQFLLAGGFIEPILEATEPFPEKQKPKKENTK